METEVDGGMSIGEVLNQLKDEFDDITISKIRFLEAEGLITPDRTGAGYRSFDPADVDRLRYVLRAQRDRYLPLKVIKEELERIDAGLPLSTPAAPGSFVQDIDAAGVTDDVRVRVPPLFEPAPADVRLSLQELSEASGLEVADLQSLRDYGLLGDQRQYDAHDLALVRLAARLMDAGLEARHLRMFRQYVDREFALIEQLITGHLRQRNPDARQAAQELTEDVVDSGARLHHLLLARALQDLLR